MSLYLGVDTSNYTTSVALCDDDGRVVLNSKKLLPVAKGERGLRQSQVLFFHTKELPNLLSSLRKFEPPAAVGVSAFPRDVKGSYMPCFLAGLSAASAIASALNVPLFPNSHQRGHIRAALYSSGRDDLVGKRYAAFHVSGGTTEMLFCDGDKIEAIGGTRDLNAGQAIDRAGVLLGLRFPCGSSLSELAEYGVLPEKPKISVDGTYCNFSGLENKVIGFVGASVPKEDVAAYVIEFVKMTLDKLCENLRGIYPDIPVICAGGVCSNRVIAAHLSSKYGASFAEPEFSSDNAAGCALLVSDWYNGEGFW
ncbi:MAG: peptidase M22 [Clostridia bacterium]|nr:peptidase M22 [Clostridia bacterium]